MAISSASSTNSARSELKTRQPTMTLENTSMTNATYTKPFQVLTYVCFATSPCVSAQIFRGYGPTDSALAGAR
jgi:hypothetical protein